MRVTNNISKNMYLTNTNRINTSMLKSMTRVMTQRRFNRVSEDIVSGVKALSIRRNLRDVKIYRDNLNASQELFASAEQSISTLADKIYIQMESELVAASNGTLDQLEMDIFAESFEQMAEEMVKTLNADFAERQIFGGTNNSVAPFSIGRTVMTNENGEVVYPRDWEKYYVNDGNGGIARDENNNVILKPGIVLEDIPKSVLYNGVPLNFDVVANNKNENGEYIRGAGTYTVSNLDLDNSGKLAFTEESEFELTEEALNTANTKQDNSLIFPGSKPIYVDIGIGIKYSDDGKVDPQTALDVSINGAAVTGSGMEQDEHGEWFSKNMIQLALDTAYMLQKGHNPAIDMDLDKANATIEEIVGMVSGGGELSDEDLERLSKELSSANVSGLIDRDQNGNYSITIGGQEIYNSASNQDAPQLSLMDSPDESYVLLANSNGGTVKLDKTGDQSYVNAVIDRANEANSNVLRQITSLGIKQNTIDFYLDRMTDTEFNLKERQNLVEGTDMSDEITNEYNLKAAYEAALKIGSWVLPRSIFDFI